MNLDSRSFWATISEWLGSLGFLVRTALSIPLGPDGGKGSESKADPDFKRWSRNDPMITGNPACRYGDDSPGRLTSNGLGSLEIGAADD